MPSSLNIPPAGASLDFLSLGALVHRLDPGIIPFRKAHECQIHVSGGEFNVAANLADCFRLQTGVATAMVDYPIGDLIGERVRAMGVKPFYKRFAHDGVWGPNMATVYSDRGQGVRARVWTESAIIGSLVDNSGYQRRRCDGRHFSRICSSRAIEPMPSFGNTTITFGVVPSSVIGAKSFKGSYGILANRLGLTT